MRVVGAALTVTLALLGLSALAGGTLRAPSEDAAHHFETRVRPLLAERCYGCHGAAKQHSRLRLDSRAAMIKGGSRGPALQPGRPEASRIIEAVTRVGELKMPPDGPLKPSEAQALTEWIKAGARWPEMQPPAGRKPEEGTWWAFQPIRRPEINRQKAKNQNPIDILVLAKLREKRLTLAPPADRRTLIRRAFFDLIGLPPAPEEMDAFLADRSEGWYEKLIDRLLASPHYGERWGRHWLDVARYADSLDSRGLGGEGDIAFAWRYRDWVVNALNRDLPYDQFIAGQIAGDLLPAEESGEFNRDGVIATGLLAIGNWGNGDADKDKILADIADDQVDVVSRAFMGLTVACARCHDHKFDPITQRDYYAVAGIFFSTHILAKLTPKGEGEKPMRIPLISAQEQERRAQQAARLKDLEARLQSLTDQTYTRHADSMRSQTSAYLLAARDYRPDPAVTIADFAAGRGLQEYALRNWLETLGPGGFLLMSVRAANVLNSPGVHAWKGPADTPSLTVNTNDTARALLTFTLPPRSVSVHPGPASGVAVTWRAPFGGSFRVSGSLADADGAGGDGIAWSLRPAVKEMEFARGEIANGGQDKISAGPFDLKAGDEIQLRVLPKASHTCDTTAVELVIEHPESGKRWDLAKELTQEPLRANPRADAFGSPDVWRFVDMGAGSRGPESKDAPDWKAWDLAVERFRAGTLDRAGLESAAAEFQKTFTLTDARSPFRPRGAADERALEPAVRDTLSKLRFDVYNLRRATPAPVEYANGALEGGVPDSPHAGVHDVPIHLRGRYDRLGEVAPRGFPAAIAVRGAPKITSGSGRLELARWLASPDHPLTARVIANRLWQHHFGEGIVRTPSNFGRLGEKPSNQPLLDYLASELRQPGAKATSPNPLPIRAGFRKEGEAWRLKRLHKLIMLSDTYRQGSAATGEALKKDPDNRLFGRMNRRRLDAESLRDALLSASGELDLSLGGPAIRDLNTKRRTLYVMSIRSDRSGYGALFDMADSTNSVDKRTVSTVAPQALFLMNHPFVRDRAAALAARLLGEKQPDDGSRIRSAYLRLYGRPAREEEVRIGLNLLGGGTESGESERLIRWTEYCQTLLAANEFVTID